MNREKIPTQLRERERERERESVYLTNGLINSSVLSLL